MQDCPKWLNFLIPVLLVAGVFVFRGVFIQLQERANEASGEVAVPVGYQEHLAVTDDEGAIETTRRLTGKCVSITDGDTIKILLDNQQIKVRLEGIDCPERDQPFGQKAKAFIGELCHGKVVTVTDMGEDRYGRTLGVVMVGNKNANKELIKAGLAWHFKRYN